MLEKIADVTKQFADVTRQFADITENVNKTMENYKEIKSKSNISLEEAKAFCKEFLKSEKETIKEEKLERTSPDLKTESMKDSTSDQIEKKPFENEKRIEIKEETGWSDEIINAIRYREEAEVYKNAGLVEAKIGGKSCLTKPDIDWEQKDAMGRTNEERANQGLAPINGGEVIELHHIGQHTDSPLAELTREEHRGKGNDAILHDKTKESEIDRQAFAREKNNHWMERAKESERAK